MASAVISSLGRETGTTLFPRSRRVKLEEYMESELVRTQEKMRFAEGKKIHGDS